MRKSTNAWHRVQAEIEKLRKENRRLRTKNLVAESYTEMNKALGFMFTYNVLGECKSRVEVAAAMEKQFGKVWYPWMKNVRDYHCEEFKLPFNLPHPKETSDQG